MPVLTRDVEVREDAKEFFDRWEETPEWKEVDLCDLEPLESAPKPQLTDRANVPNPESVMYTKNGGATWTDAGRYLRAGINDMYPPSGMFQSSTHIDLSPNLTPEEVESLTKMLQESNGRGVTIGIDSGLGIQRFEVASWSMSDGPCINGETERSISLDLIREGEWEHNGALGYCTPSRDGILTNVPEPIWRMDGHGRYRAL